MQAPKEVQEEGGACAQERAPSPVLLRLGPCLARPGHVRRGRGRAGRGRGRGGCPADPAAARGSDGIDLVAGGLGGRTRGVRELGLPPRALVSPTAAAGVLHNRGGSCKAIIGCTCERFSRSSFLRRCTTIRTPIFSAHCRPVRPCGLRAFVLAPAFEEAPPPPTPVSLQLQSGTLHRECGCRP